MLIELTSPLAIIISGIAIFLFGWLWYSPLLFMNWWLEGKGVKKENLPVRTKRYSFQVMLYTFFIGVGTSWVLALLIDLSGMETLKQALALSLFVAFGFIGLKNFSDMLYSMPETYWSFKAQKRYFVDTGFYVIAFAIATLVMYYVQTYF